MSQSQVTDAVESIDLESVDIQLQEYESTEPLDLGEPALEMLENEVNAEGERLQVAFDQQGKAILTATQHVGIVSLPDGPTIEIRPKAAGTNLLYLLRYAQGVETMTVEQRTSITAGRTFIEALAALYEAELDQVIRQGLHREYRRTNGAEKQLRGQLDLQAQLRRQGPVPTEFECTYDELTYDTVTNQAILYATSILTRLVTDRRLKQTLRQHQQLMRRRVTLTPIRPSALMDVELTRLNAHYDDLLRLTELVLRSVYIREFRTGDRASFALLVDMNRIFERAVERAMRNVLDEYYSWELETQATTRNLITGGKYSVSIRPDLLIRDESGEVVLVGDAKWKLGRPPNSDFYQIVSYQLAHDAPGMLVYPEQQGSVETEYSVIDQHQLTLIELPTSSPTSGFDQFKTQLRRSIGDHVSEMGLDS